MSARGPRLGVRLALATSLSLASLAHAQVQTPAHGEIACALFTPKEVSDAFGEPMDIRLRDVFGCRWNRPGTPSGYFLPIAHVQLRPRESFAAQNPQGGVRIDVSGIGENALVWSSGDQYYGWALTRAGELHVHSDRLDVMMSLLTLGAERLASVDAPTGTAPTPSTQTQQPSVTQTVVTEGDAASASASAEATRSTGPPSPPQPPTNFELPPPLRAEDFPRDTPDDAPFNPVDPCTLFTATEIGAALGEPVRDGGPGFLPNMCSWDTRGDDSVVIQMFAREYYEDGSRSEGGEVLAGIGERAFVDPWLGGYRAGALLATTAVGVISPKRDVSVALLRQAVERLR